MRKWYNGYLKKIKKVQNIDYPVGICLNFFKPLEAGNYDLDNMKYFYLKTLQDSLVDCKIIKDDNVKYVNSLVSNFYESDTKKLQIIVFKNESSKS
jgi:Holliday junction resolvase RusA-like endonuclease